MHEGRYCRYIRSAGGIVNRPDMGTMDMQDYVEHMFHDAASPQQLEDLADQCLDMARRLKTSGINDRAADWKKQWQRFKQEAADARDRLARFPSETSHADFFMKRTVGAPGLLYDDVRLPKFLQVHLPVDEVSVGIYETRLKNNVVYRVEGIRDCAAWLEPVGQEDVPAYKRVVSKVPGQMLRGMLALGRIEAVDPSPYEARKAA